MSEKDRRRYAAIEALNWDRGRVDSLFVEKAYPDWRRGRHPMDYPLWSMLLLSLLRAMSGYTTIRGMSDFMARHYQSVMVYLNHAVKAAPKCSTVQRMTHWGDGEQVSQRFERWAQSDEALKTFQVIAFDGKALGSTVTDCHGHHQDYVTVVSACVHNYGWVAAQVSFATQEDNEIAVARRLLEHLDVRGAWFTLDALHCQKNGHGNC